MEFLKLLQQLSPESQEAILPALSWLVAFERHLAATK